MNRIPLVTKIAPFLRGWRPGRNALARLHLPDSFELFPAAKRVLQEFGGLTYGPSNDYLRFDPNLPLDTIEEVHCYEKLIGRRLYPIGFCKHQETEPVLIDESGVIYVILDCLHIVASSFEAFIHRYTRGKAYGLGEIQADLASAGIEPQRWELDELSELPKIPD